MHAREPRNRSAPDSQALTARSSDQAAPPLSVRSKNTAASCCDRATAGFGLCQVGGGRRLICGWIVAALSLKPDRELQPAAPQTAHRCGDRRTAAQDPLSVKGSPPAAGSSTGHRLTIRPSAPPWRRHSFTASTTAAVPGMPTRPYPALNHALRPPAWQKAEGFAGPGPPQPSRCGNPSRLPSGGAGWQITQPIEPLMH